jgi:ethanolamine ammonia-lyase small subunit
MERSIAPSVSLRNKLRALTPARVGLGRTGVSQLTQDQLAFQLAHAQARDAVHARLHVQALSAQLMRTLNQHVNISQRLLCLHSCAADRATYLQRPDLGRKLSTESRAQLVHGPFDLAIVICDGLSALAVERNAAPLVAELLPRLNEFTLAPITIVEQGRVAIGDEIGLALGAELVVLLIGERPGLSSPDSLGAYITWQPRPGRTDAERNCISNIRAEGLAAAQAAAQIHYYIHAARKLKLTGVKLKEGSKQIGGN